MYIRACQAELRAQDCPGMIKLLSGVVFSSLVVAGCANNSGSTLATCEPVTQAQPQALRHWGGTVFTIVMENHSRGQIFGNAKAPYINELANRFAVADGYHDSFVHPSEPNYFWMVAGENFGVLDDKEPSAH